MSKRPQVVLPDEDLLEIRRFARRENLTVGEWMRRTLRDARMQQPVNEPSVKLKAVREAAKYSFPIPDVDQTLREIERGYDA